MCSPELRDLADPPNFGWLITWVIKGRGGGGGWLLQSCSSSSGRILIGRLLLGAAGCLGEQVVSTASTATVCCGQGGGVILPCKELGPKLGPKHVQVGPFGRPLRTREFDVLRFQSSTGSTSSRSIKPLVDGLISAVAEGPFVASRMGSAGRCVGGSCGGAVGCCRSAANLQAKSLRFIGMNRTLMPGDVASTSP